MHEIQEEYSEIFSTPGGKSISELSAAEGFFWVALFNNTPVGTIGLVPFNQEIAIIKRMFLHKDHRGREKNVSQKLMDTVLEEARRKKIKQIFLGTMSQFKAAQRFYLKNNFDEIKKEELPANMNLSPLDTVFFRLDL